jgi:hypothetical protein
MNNPDDANLAQENCYIANCKAFKADENFERALNSQFGQSTSQSHRWAKDRNEYNTATNGAYLQKLDTSEACAEATKTMRDQCKK